MTEKEWWSPGELRFTVRQVLWILENAGSLREGHWPPDPAPSGYIDMSAIRKKGGKGAHFIRPIEIIAEIEIRLEKCGVDGLILEAIECWGKSEESMARYFGMPVWSVWKRRKKALGYVASGPGRRWLDSKKRKAESYQDYKRRT